jgi:hypothetical protein
MGVRDDDLDLCSALDISGVATTSTDSTDWVHIPQVKDHKDTSVNDRPNVSGRLHWNCVVDGADLLAGTDGSIITFTLHADTDATSITTDGDVILTKAITANTPADQADGTYLFSIPLPVDQFNPYLQMKAVISVQTLSTGSIASWIGTPIQQGQ